MEMLEFIDNSGKVVEHVFESIVDCINSCQCPHVVGAPKQYVGEAKICALRVAAVVGFIPECEETCNTSDENGYIWDGTMLSTFEIALLRRGEDSPVVKRGDLNLRTQLLKHVSKWKEDLTASQSEYLELDQANIFSFSI